MLWMVKNNMHCNRKCINYKVQPSANNIGRYLTQKRCTICEIFIQWSELRCPCCNSVLRVKPRNNYNRRNFQNNKKIGRY